MRRRTVLMLAFVGYTITTWAQPKVDQNAIRQKFPEARAVTLVEEEQLIFKVKGDKLDIKNAYFSQQLHLDEQMASYNERSHSVYRRFF